MGFALLTKGTPPGRPDTEGRSALRPSSRTGPRAQKLVDKRTVNVRKYGNTKASTALSARDCPPSSLLLPAIHTSGSKPREPVRVTRFRAVALMSQPPPP